MINRTNQKWQIGEIVNVGFLKLRVIDVRPSLDGTPDTYLLQTPATDCIKHYEFTPYYGVKRIK